MANLLTNGALAEDVVNITTSLTPIELVTTSPTIIILDGSLAQTVILPDATTLFPGMRYVISNRSSGIVTIQNNALNIIGFVSPGKEKECRVYSIVSPGGSWDLSVSGDFNEEKPLKIFASVPPNSLLTISSSFVVSSDGSGLTIAPIGTIIPNTVTTTIDFLDGSISGSPVTLGAGGPPLVFPTSTAGYYRRMVFSLQADESIAVAFSDEEASLLMLPNAGSLFYSLGGTPFAYIDIQQTTVNLDSYKTADSVTDVIEPRVGSESRIFNLEGGSGSSASGLEGEIQYNKSGVFGSDPNFMWDEVESSLDLGGLKIDSLISFDLENNQVTPQTIFTVPHAENNFIEMIYSIVRGTAYHIGRLLIVTDGTTVSFSDDLVNINSTGIVFSCEISGPDLSLQYTSTNTTTGTLKFSRRRWA